MKESDVYLNYASKVISNYHLDCLTNYTRRIIVKRTYSNIYSIYFK